jgi:hypothetical protein
MSDEIYEKIRVLKVEMNHTTSNRIKTEYHGTECYICDDYCHYDCSCDCHKNTEEDSEEYIDDDKYECNDCYMALCKNSSNCSCSCHKNTDESSEEETIEQNILITVYEK